METKTQECEKSKRVFETIITLLGQKAEVAHKYTGKNIVLNVTSEDPGRLIGRRGIALNSITHLMNLVLKREDGEHPHVVIDVKGIGEEDRGERERGPRKDKRNNKRNNNRRNNKNSESNETTEPKTEAKAEPKTEAKAEPKTEAKAEPKTEAKAEPKTEAKAEPKTEAKAEPKTEAKAEPETEAKAEPKTEAKAEPKKKLSRLEIECRNSSREVKKWGEDTYLPPMTEGDCFKALDYFKNDKEITAAIDESRTSGDKKRVKLSIQQ